MRRLVPVLATLCALRSEARADDWSIHILGTAQIGYTDNLFSSPRTAPAGITPAPQPVEADLFVGIRPGVLATYGTPRAIHEFTYSLDGTVYLLHTDFSTLFNTVGYRGFFILGPRSELTTTVGGSFGNSNLFPSTAASGGVVTAQRSGSVEALGGEVGQGYTYTLSRDWRLTQGLAARYERTTTSGNGASTASELGARLALEKAFRYDALIFSAGATYLELSAPINGGAASQTDNQTNARGTVTWLHDLTRYWSLSLNGGGVAVIPTGGTGSTQIVPIAGATLGYYPAWGTASLSVRRDVAPNLLLAQNTLTDTAVASCWLPLPWLRKDPVVPTLSVQGTLGVARVRLIDAQLGKTASSIDDLLGDLAINWNVSKTAGFSLRYQLIWQSSDLAATPPLFGFVRNTVVLQFFGRWPERLAVEIPVRDSMRADRSNVTPIGEEVPSPGSGGGNNR